MSLLQAYVGRAFYTPDFRDEPHSSFVAVACWIGSSPLHFQPGADALRAGSTDDSFYFAEL
jgi:hypothetical protein